MPSKKPTASSKSAASAKGSTKGAKPTAKPTGKSAAAKSPPPKAAAAKAPAKAPPAKVPPKTEAKAPAKAAGPAGKGPAPAVKPGVRPKPIPFTIKSDRPTAPVKKESPRAGSGDHKPRPDPKALYGPNARYTVMTADAMAASRAAAAKLAAAAGLHPVKNTANGDGPTRNYTRVTKSPFDKKELSEFREILLVKRRQIEGDVNAMEHEALSGSGGSLSHLPQHMADQGTDTFDQSLALDLAASQRGLLKEIDDALGRIEAGTYGICEEMGKPISVERLRHTPWARFCIEAARAHERAAYHR